MLRQARVDRPGDDCYSERARRASRARAKHANSSPSATSRAFKKVRRLFPVCGICGEIRFDGHPISLQSIQTMADSLAPRGPDGSGVVARGNAALGHRRLSIIDLSQHSTQPMVDAELGVTIVYSGAIYNYRSLRRALEDRGYRFFSSGDTEVLIKAYHAWGEDFVERLNGMFAFAIVERDSGKLFLARDRLGIKPLYYSHEPHRFRFASTLPSLVRSGDIDRSLDPIALHHYMTFHSVVPAPHTILRGVRKLPPATVAVLTPDGALRQRRYWELRFTSS